MKLSKRGKRVVLALSPVIVIALVFGLGSIPDGPLRITPPPTDAEPGRWVHIEGAANTRDAGGYPTRDGHAVKHGAVYRSGKLSRLSDRGADDYRELEITTVIDFCNRVTTWPLFGGDVWAVQRSSDVRGCPMSFEKEGSPAEFYIRGVHDNAAEYRKAFEILADPTSYPVLYHCAAGTDRTGVMSALLLSLLGVERDAIIADFRLSEKVGAPGSLPALKALLDAIEHQGGIEAFLENEIGVSRATQAKVREQLLESP